MTSEVWKPVPGFLGRYEVSTLGRVRSLDRVVPKRNRWGREGTTSFRGRVLSQKVRRDGYLEVALHDEGESRSWLVASLVALAFIGPRPEGMQVCHEDGKKDNARAANLRYDTPAGNNADKLLHGTLPRGESNHAAKLTAADVLEIRRRAGEAQRLLAEEFGCTFSNISAIQRRKSWRHV